MSASILDIARSKLAGAEQAILSLREIDLRFLQREISSAKLLGKSQEVLLQLNQTIVQTKAQINHLEKQFIPFLHEVIDEEFAKLNADENEAKTAEEVPAAGEAATG